MGFLIKQAKYTRSTDRTVSDLLDIISLNDNSLTSNIAGDSALLQSDIFTAVRIIASDLASAEYSVKNNANVYDLLNKRANESTTSYNFIFALIANTLLNSKGGFALIERNEAGMTTALRNLKSSEVSILESEDGKELGYRVVRNSKSTDVDYNDMIHLKPFSTDGKIGISPIYSLTPELSMQKNGVALLVNSFKKGISTSGILQLAKGNLNNESKKVIRESFEQANSGSQNSGSVMVLGEGETFTQLEVDTKVLDMIQNNKYSTQQIAKTFGIPLSRFGQELVNSSDIDANDLYISSTLNAYRTMIVQELEKLNTDIQINFSILQGRDKNTLLYKLISEKQGEGILTVNELRSFYNFPSIDNGDEIYKNSASKPLSELLKGGE